MEKINKKTVIIVILSLIALLILKSFISSKFEKWETRQRFIDNISKECASNLSNSSYDHNSLASAYLNRIGLKVEEETYILIVNECARLLQNK